MIGTNRTWRNPRMPAVSHSSPRSFRRLSEQSGRCWRCSVPLPDTCYRLDSQRSLAHQRTHSPFTDFMNPLLGAHLSFYLSSLLALTFLELSVSLIWHRANRTLEDERKIPVPFMLRWLSHRTADWTALTWSIQVSVTCSFGGSKHCRSGCLFFIRAEGLFYFIWVDVWQLKKWLVLIVIFVVWIGLNESYFFFLNSFIEL